MVKAGDLKTKNEAWGGGTSGDSRNYRNCKRFKYLAYIPNVK